MIVGRSIICLMSVWGWLAVLAFAPSHADAVAEQASDVSVSEATQRLEPIRLLVNSGKYEEAESLATALLNEAENEAGERSRQVAEVLDVLVDILWRGSKVRDEATLLLAERAVQLKEDLWGPTDPALCSSLINLAIVLDESGSPQQALPNLERALAITEQGSDPDDQQIARINKELGFLYKSMGDYEQAWRKHEAARIILMAQPTRDEQQLSQVLNGQAVALYEMGDYSGARVRWEETLEIRERMYHPKHPKVATILNNLGILLTAIGDFENAERYLQRSLTLQVEFNPNSRFVASALNNLAILKIRSRDFAAAETLLERALRILENTLGADNPVLVTPLHNLARSNQALHKWDASEAYYTRALDIAETKLSHWHPEVGWILQDQALLYHQTKQPRAARAALIRSLAVCSTALGTDHPDIAETLLRLAFVLAEEEPAAALDTALRAEALGRRHLSMTTRGSSERDALFYAQAQMSGLGLALQLVGTGAIHDPTMIRRLWDDVIRSRALVLDEISMRNWIASQTEDPALQNRFAELREARERLANLSLRGRSQTDAEGYRKQFEAALRKAEDIERDLARQSQERVDLLATRQTGLAEVAAQLPAGSALIAYAMYRPFDADELLVRAGSAWSETQTGETQPRAVAFVVRAGAHPVAVPLGRVYAIDSLVARWREEAAIGAIAEGRGLKTSDRAYRIWGTALRNAVWDPIAPHLEEAKQIFIAPDGSLNLLNFSALPMDAGQYLIESGVRIHYLAAERDLAQSQRHGGTGKGLLALGGATFSQSPEQFATATRSMSPPETEPVGSVYRGGRLSCEALEVVTFGPLPETDREVRDILQVWHQAMSTNQIASSQSGAGLPAAPMDGDSGTVVLVGSDATEAAFKANAPGKRIVHLATHGFFLQGNCTPARSMMSAALPSDASSGSPPGTRGIGGLSVEKAAAPPVTSKSSVLQAGLAFAGVNHRSTAPSRNDGILFAEEIATMDLHDVQWAVLSACDTGIGEVLEGEGVLGLRRAFQVAGAQSLIMSLWKVDDVATRQWMTALYTAHLEEGLGTAEAVYQASRTILEQRREDGVSTHPFYWASFVAAGDWR